MIIFSGAGILGLVIPLASGAIGMWVGTLITGNSNSMVSAIIASIFALAGCVATWLLGVYLNKTRPARDLAARMDARSDQLHALADAGRFSRGPGFLPPTSMAEAHQQADAMAIEEYTALKDKVTNRNTLFWIPLQYWAIVSVAISAVLVAVGLR